MKLIASFVAMWYIHEKSLLSPWIFLNVEILYKGVLQDIIGIVVTSTMLRMWLYSGFDRLTSIFETIHFAFSDLITV
jgi:hypothetical protein